MTRIFRITAFFLAMLLLISGCSSKSSEDDPIEVPTASAVTSDKSVLRLFDEARDAYSRELYSIAKKHFTTLKSSYPSSPYSTYAEIKIADCEFISKDYDLAAVSYENFLKQHPGYQANDYIILRTGRSYHLLNRGVGRSSLSLEKAVSYYDQLLVHFPSSVYVATAKQHKAEALEILASNQKAILKFYKKQGFKKAYKDRLREYKESWGQNTLPDRESAS